MRKTILTIFLCLITGVVSQAFGQEHTTAVLKTARIFGDNMVIQRSMNAPVWGYAAPGQAVTVTFAGFTTNTITDSAGRWLLYMPPLQAGGPYEMRVEDGRQSIIYKNVMVGEVWLASGQSNMEFTIGRPVDSSDAVIKEAQYPAIREFHVPHDVSSVPLTDLQGGEWMVCSPQTVGGFSAAAYFFARSLHLDQQVPVGIIHSSVGGTFIEAWLSAGMLFTHPDFKNRIIDLRKKQENWADMQAKESAVAARYKAMIDTTSEGIRQGVNMPRYNDAAWSNADYPVFQSHLKTKAYRFIWLRKTFNLPAAPKGPLNIFLGEVKMRNAVYLNGVIVGNNKREEPATYTVPPGLLKKGKNVIAVKWLCEWGYGRFGNVRDTPALRAANGKVLAPLSGSWRYNENIEPELLTPKGYSNNLAALYNAMISPLMPYGIKGALWYQGEANAGRAAQYENLLPLLFTDWRTRWKEGNFPFLVVQLPNYKDGGMNWVRMRESQAKALQYPAVGMAVTTDVGDSIDIHPKNKRPVGERLYAIARDIAYHKPGISTGPVMESYHAENSSMIIQFGSTGSGVITKGNKALKGFEIAGADQKFYPATAVINGSTLLISSKDVKDPVAVRYNWAANPTGNFYNSNGLPAAPFRTDNWAY